MEKEVLSHERFLCDYKTRIQKNLKSLIPLLIVLLCVSILMIIALIHLVAEIGFAFFVILYIVVLVGANFVFIDAMICCYNGYQAIKSKRYYVVTDEVIGKQEAERYHGRFFRTYSIPAKIEFRAYGEYFPNMKYTGDSSDQFAVSDVDNFYGAFIGEEFLLVINKKSKILLIYNTKFFTYPHKR